jgi:O-antigen/teichoic acid export membrane protein
MAMAVTSLLGAIVQGIQIRAVPVEPGALLKTGRSFWLIGRWVMTANLTNILTGVCCTFALARSHGDGAVGRFAAVSNLLRIANPLFITLATLIVPAVALVSASGQNRKTLGAAWRASRHYGIRGMVLLAPYWLALLIFPGQALALLYHHRPEYRGLENDVRIFVGISVLSIINAVLASLFNGLRRSRRALVAQLVGAAACVVITIPMTIMIGLPGLLLGTLVSNGAMAASLAVLYLLLRREIDNPAQPTSQTLRGWWTALQWRHWGKGGSAGVMAIRKALRPASR